MLKYRSPWSTAVTVCIIHRFSCISQFLIEKWEHTQIPASGTVEKITDRKINMFPFMINYSTCEVEMSNDLPVGHGFQPVGKL